MSDIEIYAEKTVKVKVKQKVRKPWGEEDISISAKTDADQDKIIDNVRISSPGWGGLSLSPLEFVALYKLMEVFSDQIEDLNLESAEDANEG